MYMVNYTYIYCFAGSLMNILAILSLHITTVMYLDVTSYYYHCCPFEMSITTITTYICDSNGTITTLFPLHYVLSVLLLPITTVIMRPLLPINQVSNE
jgi:hypothetical protein